MCVRMLKQNKSEYDVNSRGKTEYTPRQVFVQNRLSTGRKGSQNWKCAEVQIVLLVPVLDDGFSKSPISEISKFTVLELGK